MDERIKKIGRSCQVYLPWLTDFKFAAQNAWYRRAAKPQRPALAGLRQLGLDNSLFVDVGAHRGQSIVAFQRLVPGVRILSVEPNRMLAERLQRRYKDDPSVDVHACALASEPGELTLHVPYYRKFMFDGLASVHHDEAAGWLNADRIIGFHERHVSVKTSTVEALPLDHFNVRPSVLKLTAQRAEIDILRGAEATLAASDPIIISAWPWPELLDDLAARGYSPYQFKGDFRPGLDEHSYFQWFFSRQHIAKYGFPTA